MKSIILIALASIGVHGDFRYETWRTTPTVRHALVWTNQRQATVRELVVTPHGVRWLNTQTVRPG